MAGASGHDAQSMYICVDEHPQFIHILGEALNTNGALLYFIVPDCGGTDTIGHCPPYDTTDMCCLYKIVNKKHKW